MGYDFRNARKGSKIIRLGLVFLLVWTLVPAVQISAKSATVGSWDRGTIQKIAAGYKHSLDEIYGEIRNYTDKDWSYVEITIALYDENDEYVGNANAVIAETISPNGVASFKTDGGGLYNLKATKYELMRVSPM
jgi:hypothetical protein